MNPGKYLAYSSSLDTDSLTNWTLKGKWKNVIAMYYEFPAYHSKAINDSVGTALHVAVDLNKEDVVEELLDAIIMRWQQEGQQSARIEALEVENKRGDTPLHVAASRGFARICELIIGRNKEWMYLASLKNKHGETPLFQAAINWKEQAFAYLSSIWKNNHAPWPDLVRDNGDTILHCAIKSEYFDLAVIIVHYYEFLGAYKNKEGITPLKVLATRPSAFRSGIKLPWWKEILYQCILVEPLDPDRQMKENLAKMKKQPKSDFPKNYATLYDFIDGLSRVAAALIGKMDSKNNQHDTENPSINKRYTSGFLPPNYETFLQFVRSVYVYTLGLSGVDIKEVKETKKRHQWGRQLLKRLLNKSLNEYTDGGGRPADRDVDQDAFIVYREYMQGGGGEPRDMQVEPDAFNVYSTHKQGETSLSKVLEQTDQHADEENIAKKNMVGETSRSKVLEEETKSKVDGKSETLSGSDTKKETDQHVDEKSIVIIRREISCLEELEEERIPKVDGKIETLSQSNTKKETDQYADEKNIVIIKRKISRSEVLEEERKPKADDKTKSLSDTLETPFLVAARNGIVEIVNGILSKIPSAIHDTNSREENVLLVAVRNKKPHVVEKLRKKFQEEEPEVWDTLTLAVNKDGKTILHMAAYAPEDYKPWQVSGSALQMMWDVNLFQYIRSLVPKHYYLRSDEHNQTASEIFKEEHKELRKESSDWLKETSESCSVVAALVAGVSFATAATIPGGNDDKGMPHLEDEPAFHAFVISSLIGLCFSVTGLIMFLTILTSRRLHRDFGRSLPLKLLLGLSSLFVSVVALLVSFCTSHSFLFRHKHKTFIFPIYVATCLPVTFYAVAQLPIYFDLLAAILVEVPKASNESDSI